MPCFSPLQGYRRIGSDGAPEGGSVLFSPPRHEGSRRILPHIELPIPCGQCEGCRAAKGKHWATRLALEANTHGADRCCFITLTYAPEHLPADMGLSLRDIQLFMKRLRKALSKDGTQLQYFLVGEYGDRLARPHYHMALYGTDFRDGSKPHGKRGSNNIWTHDTVARAWGMGRHEIGSLQGGSCMYVAGYVLKKANRISQFSEFVPKRESFDLLSPAAIALANNHSIAKFGQCGTTYHLPQDLKASPSDLLLADRTPPEEVRDWLFQFPRTSRKGGFFKGYRTEAELDQALRYFRWNTETGHPTLVAPEFSLMSRRPGIAHNYLLDNAGQILANGFVMPDRGMKRAIPPAFFTKLQSLGTYDELIAAVKADRVAQAIAKRAENPDEYSPQRLETKREIHTLKLKRHYQSKSL